MRVVRAAGVEPALRLAKTDFKSVASTSFATPAYVPVSASPPVMAPKPRGGKCLKEGCGVVSRRKAERERMSP